MQWCGRDSLSGQDAKTCAVFRPHHVPSRCVFDESHALTSTLDFLGDPASPYAPAAANIISTKVSSSDIVAGETEPPAAPAPLPADWPKGANRGTAIDILICEVSLHYCVWQCRLRSSIVHVFDCLDGKLKQVVQGARALRSRTIHTVSTNVLMKAFDV